MLPTSLSQIQFILGKSESTLEHEHFSSDTLSWSRSDSFLCWQYQNEGIPRSGFQATQRESNSRNTRQFGCHGLGEEWKCPRSWPLENGSSSQSRSSYGKFRLSTSWCAKNARKSSARSPFQRRAEFARNQDFWWRHPYQIAHGNFKRQVAHPYPSFCHSRAKEKIVSGSQWYVLDFYF